MKTGLRSLFWLLFAIVTLWKAALAGSLEPCYDEGYYFFWSLNPQLSYFDHPPMVAWLMAVSGAVFGDSVWTIRIWPLVMGMVFVLVGRALARRMFDSAVGDWTGIVLLLVPVFAGNSLVMTPDVPFAAAWALAVFTAWRALAEPAARRWRWWVATGCVAGLGFLAKYNMVLFFFGLGVYWILAPGRRMEVFRGTFVAGLVALVLFSPVIFWNATHDWSSFRFQLSHGFTRLGGSVVENVTLHYLGALLMVVSPLLGVAAFLECGKAIRVEDQARRFLAAFFWAPIVFFMFSALKTRVGPNWPMLAFFTGAVLVASAWEKYVPAWRAAILGSAAACTGAILLAGSCLALPDHVANTLGLNRLRIPRAEEFTGGRNVAAELARVARQHEVDFVFTERHNVFGRVAFFQPEFRERLWQMGSGRRRMPWVDPAKWRGKKALIVMHSGRIEKVASCFEKVEPAGECPVPVRGRAKEPLHLWVGFGYHPEIEQTDLESRQAGNAAPSPGPAR